MENILYCYNCGKKLDEETERKHLVVSESPKDNGIRVPFCLDCVEFYVDE